MPYRFDSELEKFIPLIKDTDFTNPVQARQDYEARVKAMVPEVKTEGLIIEDRLIPGYENEPDVRVRIYKPEKLEQNGAALLQIHGGGFVIGSLETEHAVAARHAREMGVVVVSVDYRLAPEHPYPCGLHDCYAALVWLHESVDEFSLDTTRIGIYGVSAGGGLAAGLTLMVRELNGPAICFQCLNIPELDDRLQTTSAIEFVDTPIWNRPKAELSWTYYLGSQLERGSDDVPLTAAPARANDLSGLPPAYICVMEFDPLRDEGIHYAMELMQQGVPVELHAFPGTFHGSAQFPVAISKRQMQEMLLAMRRGFNLSS